MKNASTQYTPVIINRVSLVKEPEVIPNKIKITESSNVYNYIKDTIYSDSMELYESFNILLLNNSNVITGRAEISRGGLTGTLVDIRLIAKYALESLAVGVILIHNHPSGNLKPSEADKTITSKIKKALSFLDIKVLDHLIVTENDYFSFATQNLI